MKTHTMRRDTLLKLARAGRLVAVGGYHYTRDEPTEGDRFAGRLPVNVTETGRTWETRKEGYYNIPEHDFTGNCGHASKSDDGRRVHLYVHSNCNHDFEIVEANQKQLAG